MLKDSQLIQLAFHPGYHVIAWLGLIGPAGLPPEISNALEKAALEVISDHKNKSTLDLNGFLPNPANSKEFTAFVKSEYASWGKIITERGYTAD